MAGLPDNIRALAEFAPIEDMLLAILRAGLPGIQVKSAIEAHQTFPLVLVRRSPSNFSQRPGDARFVISAEVDVHTFCEDPDGDQDASLLAEAVRVVLRDAWRNQTVVPGIGHITHFEMSAAPRRVSDWATATGPVQYADLPTGVWRYQTDYSLEVKKAPTLSLPTAP